MIISASRRTDIPAFYAEWFMNRIRAGYCEVPNPFNRAQVSRVSLVPEDVEAIVFWTRNPGPLLQHLLELDRGGFRYYFLYTLLASPRLLEPKAVQVDDAVATFKALSGLIGAGRVIWRYDPIVLSTLTGIDFHCERFGYIAAALQGWTQRVVISFLDVYSSIRGRLAALEGESFRLLAADEAVMRELAGRLAGIAVRHGMEIVSCAEGLDFSSNGVRPGKCIDDCLIERVLGVSVSGRKDPGQRKECRCVASRDIGMYNACPSRCVYCYATRDFAAAAENWARHDPAWPALVKA